VGKWAYPKSGLNRVQDSTRGLSVASRVFSRYTIPVQPEHLYLETTVWSFLFADDTPERRDTTQLFIEFVTQQRWSVSISALVLDEILATKDDQLRSHLAEAVKRIAPREILVTSEVLALASKYVLQGTIPDRYIMDARHLAVAVVAGEDVVVSWNLRHLVKLKTRREVNAVNLLNGYRTIEIVTPEEMI
jgi:hypothetical protein